MICQTHQYYDGTCLNCGQAEPESNLPNVALRHIDSVGDEVAGKLLKMVALAHDAKDDSTRRGEFESAMAAAVKYSQRHHIDLNTIDPTGAARTSGQAGVSTEEFLNKQVKVSEGLYRRPPAHKFVCAILTEFFSVEIIRGIGAASSIIWIIGRESHVKFAEYAYFYLVETFNRLWRADKVAHGRIMADRASYFYGLWWGLHEKLKQAKAEGRAEIIGELAEKSERSAEELSETYQLVVVREKDLLRQATNNHHPVLIPGKNTFQNGVKFGSSALYQGKHDGGSVEVARPLDTEASKPKRGELA